MSPTATLTTIHQHIMWNRLISVVEEQVQAGSAPRGNDATGRKATGHSCLLGMSTSGWAGRDQFRKTFNR